MYPVIYTHVHHIFTINYKFTALMCVSILRKQGHVYSNNSVSTVIASIEKSGKHRIYNMLKYNRICLQNA